ncbi:MAG: sulfatase, partial [Planctomycetota bacterium]
LHAEEKTKRPNILFVFSDDHAIASISSYREVSLFGQRLAKVAPTPYIDRLAKEGAIFLNSFCANSICGPSRATILTGKHSHKNGFMRNDGKGLDQSQWTVSKALQASGYTTAVIGKWHLKTTPLGFDYWEVFPGQGSYYNPAFIQMDTNKGKRFEGYATDLATDKAIAWLDRRDASKPFFLMCQHKAPHRTFAPPLRHLGAFDDVEIPEPETLFDNYANRSATLAKNEMEIDRHFDWAYDAKVRKDERGDVKLPKPDRYGTPEYRRMSAEQKKRWDAHFGPRNQRFLEKFSSLNPKEVVRWKYRRYMRNYLGTVRAVDESVGKLLKYLDEKGLAENTVVIYSSDQGFYLGEHGWYDKRWMFEESFRMPFLVRWPGVVKPGARPTQLIQNIDYAPTFLEIAGLTVPESAQIQGRSLIPLLRGEGASWRESLYYAYYEFGEHAVPRHFGVRTMRHKLIHFPGSDEWNLFDLEKDPREMKSVYDDPAYQGVRDTLSAEFVRLRRHYDAPPMKKGKKS